MSDGLRGASTTNLTLPVLHPVRQVLRPRAPVVGDVFCRHRPRNEIRHGHAARSYFTGAGDEAHIIVKQAAEREPWKGVAKQGERMRDLGLAAESYEYNVLQKDKSDE